MEKTINALLKDIYRVEPSLRGKEAEMKKLLKELIGAKPDVEIGPAFREELKRKLLAGFREEEREKKGFFALLTGRPFYRLAAGVSFVLVLAFGVFIGYNQLLLKHSGGANSVAVTESLPVVVSKAVSRPGAQAKGKAMDGKKSAMPKSDQLMADDVASYSIAQGPSEAIARQVVAGKDSPVSPMMLAKARVANEESKPEMRKEAEEKRLAEPVDADKSVLEQDREGNTESYERIVENPFLESVKNPLSTFSIDVDTASYANLRRFLNGGQLPYPDAVRIEEMINYFSYNYEGPKDEHPFAFHTEVASCPWNQSNRVLMIGMQGRKMDLAQMPPMNLVFLLDVSGSMEDENKLPLLRQALKLLVAQMRREDTIAIVVYAGAAGVVLPATSGADKNKIIDSLDKLSAGGSTAGGEGIELAYKIASENFKPDGNNRIMLCTDGDFNVGASSEGEMTRLIEQKREKGIYLSVLGFGMGNYKDSMMEKLADKGNGNYAYIDTLAEAKKVLVNQAGGTLLTIAKDVKLQIEFNPAHVKSYRLIGYENRVMRAEDFNDDKKDAGELGAGHTVTALYEIVPAEGAETKTELKYQTTKVNDAAKESPELATIKFRYKRPKESKSILMEKPIVNPVKGWREASENMRFAMSVAEWGMILRGSEFIGNGGYHQVLELGKGALGRDTEGYRAEYIGLVEKAKKLDKRGK